MIFNNSNGEEILRVEPSDSSYRYRSIMGENALTLYFSLPGHIELPIGTWCEFEGEKYTLELAENFKKHGTQNFEYTVVMESAQAKLKKYKCRDTVEGRLKFNFMGRPREVIQLIVDNMNRREKGWTVGECIDMTERLMSFNHAYCFDALTQAASIFETEFEIDGKKIHFGKVEYNKDTPLPLSYGRGNGFKPGVGRANFENSRPVEILFVQGGERNIEWSKYGSRELLLPKEQTIAYDGSKFEDEDMFNESMARHYITDDLGLSVMRLDKPLETQAEDSIDLTNIYPKHSGIVTAVEEIPAPTEENPENRFYDFFDTKTIPEELDFSQYIIPGEKATVIFQSGMLAGREFEIATNSDGDLTGYVHSERRFKLVSQKIDGMDMPNEQYRPKSAADYGDGREGDGYAVFNIMLPEAYICNDADKSGASWTLFREAVRRKYEVEENRFSFTGELDGIWSKNDWLNIGGKIRLGSYVDFSDTSKPSN